MSSKPCVCPLSAVLARVNFWWRRRQSWGSTSAAMTPSVVRGLKQLVSFFLDGVLPVDVRSPAYPCHARLPLTWRALLAVVAVQWLGIPLRMRSTRSRPQRTARWFPLRSGRVRSFEPAPTCAPLTVRCYSAQDATRAGSPAVASQFIVVDIERAYSAVPRTAMGPCGKFNIVLCSNEKTKSCHHRPPVAPHPLPPEPPPPTSFHACLCRKL